MGRAYALSLTVALILLLPVVEADAQSVEEEDLALVYGDKSTISIATGRQQALRRAPAVATVITAQDIAAMGATDLDDVLESVPGLHVTRTNSYNTSLYLIRGIFAQNNPQTLILMNGVPVTTMLVGNKGNIWSGYPVEHIARIEVIRGPGSALYGADAYSGVINIITKTATDIQGTQLGVRVGSFKTHDAWVLHGGKAGEIEVAAYLRAGRSDGFRETIEADAQTRNDRIFGTRASLAPGPVNTDYEAVDVHLDLGYEKWRMRANYKLRDDVGTGAGIASALDPVGKEKSARLLTDLSWNDPQFGKDWGVGVVGSYMQYLQRMPTYLQLLPPGATLPAGTFPNGMIGAPETSERQFRLSGFATYSGFDGHNIRLGVGHDDLNMYDTSEFRNFNYTASGVPIPVAEVTDFSGSAPFILPQRRRLSYLYAQDEWNFAKDWAVTAGVRHDWYSDSGTTTNPRLALVWDAALDVTAKLMYGHAFRAPAFAELYGINNPVSEGNPDLKPETISTWEAAISWQARRDTQVNVSVFHYSMHDIIRLVPKAVPGTGSIYQNTGDQTGHGMELEVLWDASRNLRLSGNLAYQRSIDGATSRDAGYAPRMHAYGRADWRFAGGWLLCGQVNHVADRRRAAGDARQKVPDYTTVDLTLRTEPRKNSWSFAASVRNLLNAEVREPSLAPGLAIPNDLPMAPRSVYFQAAYQL
jgi:outer membrane receptor for ferrienterochelin and colicin